MATPQLPTHGVLRVITWRNEYAGGMRPVAAALVVGDRAVAVLAERSDVADLVRDPWWQPPNYSNYSLAYRHVTFAGPPGAALRDFYAAECINHMAVRPPAEPSQPKAEWTAVQVRTADGNTSPVTTPQAAVVTPGAGPRRIVEDIPNQLG